MTSFGVQVMDLPPTLEAYPEHDHSESGQEEDFVTLRGSGEIELDGERVPLDPETMVRVGPGVRRKLWPGPEGMRVLALGGTPGAVYEIPPVTVLGPVEGDQGMAEDLPRGLPRDRAEVARSQELAHRGEGGLLRDLHQVRLAGIHVAHGDLHLW